MDHMLFILPLTTFALVALIAFREIVNVSDY